MYDFTIMGKRYSGYCLDAKNQPARNKTIAKEIEAEIRSDILKKIGGYNQWAPLGKGLEDMYATISRSANVGNS